jgi:hypothetical protein
VTQHKDFDFLGLGRSAAEHDQLEDLAQRQVEERPDHRHPSRGRQGTTAHRSPSQGRPDPLVTSTIDFWHPTGVAADGQHEQQDRAAQRQVGKSRQRQVAAVMRGSSVTVPNSRAARTCSSQATFELPHPRGPR